MPKIDVYLDRFERRLRHNDGIRVTGPTTKALRECGYGANALMLFTAKSVCSIARSATVSYNLAPLIEKLSELGVGKLWTR